MDTVPLEGIQAARSRLSEVALQTPLLPAFGLDMPDGNELWLKAENLQRTSSFKIRGAYNAVASLGEEERRRGVITYSSGNHGQAVACAACLLGISAVVVMPDDAVPMKVRATEAWGARVEFAGHTSLSRQERALELAETEGYVEIPPFDDARIVAGQGTVGLEIVEQLAALQAVFVPVGGGGLLSGIATAVKSLRPDVKVIGVEPEGGADAQQSLRSGTLMTWDHVDTIADGLRTSRVGELNFATIQRYVDDIVTVSDEEILWTVRVLASNRKLVVEPSGAAATAAVLFGRTGFRDSQLVAVISGGNVEPTRLASYLEDARPAPPAAESVSAM